MKKRFPCLLLAIFMSSSEGAADQIALKNGDRITGSIVGLEAGELRMQSELLGALAADWDAIESVRSDTAFYVALSDGRLLVGSFVSNVNTVEIRTTETES